MAYQNSKDLAEAQYYLKMLDDFCKTGKVIIPPSHGRSMPWDTEEDPLKDNLIHLFGSSTNPIEMPFTGEVKSKFQLQVVNSKIRSKVFYDYVGKFVVECVHHIRFQRQRAWTENHRAESLLLDSEAYKRMDKSVWKPLLDQLEKEHEKHGFDKPFFMRLFENGGAAKTEYWERLVRDWQACIKRQTLAKLKDFIDLRKDNFEIALIKMMEQITRSMKKEEIPETRAVQAWELMNGGWTETEFERRLNEMKVQDRYPAIPEIVAKMGRTTDSNGKERLAIASGVSLKMEHSAGSDIEGITIGDDLNALLPLEMAQYCDEDMEGLFIYKYRTRRLQTFRYKSEMTKPSRKLGFTHATRKGPMIVCIDTSASMYGTPERISSTLLTLIEQTAEELERACYLIDFSVSVRAIDLMAKRKARQLKKLGLQTTDIDEDRDSDGNEKTNGSTPVGTQKKQATHLPFIGGGTSARKLMDTLFDLLDNDNMPYVNADVLWITDFMIPQPPASMLQRLSTYKDTGTHFYGLCIVHEQDKGSVNSWETYFNKIYTITYRPVRKY